jgi:Xaa-Pro aminopeptidase
MTEHGSRLARARIGMADRGIDAMCLSVGSDLPYLIGYRAMPLERLTMLVLPVAGEAVLVAPELEAPRVDRSDDLFSLRPWGELEDPIALVDGLLGDAGRVAIGDETWTRFSLALQNAAEVRSWTTAGDLMADLRIIKSPAEIAALRSAAVAADAVMDQMAGVAWSGRTERDVAREIVDRGVAEGHEVMDFWIVASGPNGASPHHEPADRVIGPGDAVVVDFGGRKDGYASDTTRMFVVGEPPEGFVDAYDVLRRAQAAAVEHVRPGVTAASVDAVARAVIDDAGYGDRFIHRVGHGIGMDTHEHPYLVGGNDLVLEPGMAFSVEPGIYEPGSWGMRIEDIVVVTEDGVEPLNRTDHAYRTVE